MFAFILHLVFGIRLVHKHIQASNLLEGDDVKVLREKSLEQISPECVEPKKHTHCTRALGVTLSDKNCI